MGTNFPQWMGGDYQFRVRLCPYVGTMSDEEAYRIANRTLSDFGVDALVETDSDIELLSFKISEDLKGAVLRIKSTAKHNQIISLKPKFNYRKCYVATITEELQCEIKEEIQLESAPYEIHTLYFER